MTFVPGGDPGPALSCWLQTFSKLLSPSFLVLPLAQASPSCSESSLAFAPARGTGFRWSLSTPTAPRRPVGLPGWPLPLGSQALAHKSARTQNKHALIPVNLPFFPVRVSDALPSQLFSRNLTLCLRPPRAATPQQASGCWEWV